MGLESILSPSALGPTEARQSVYTTPWNSCRVSHAGQAALGRGAGGGGADRSWPSLLSVTVINTWTKTTQSRKFTILGSSPPELGRKVAEPERVNNNTAIVKNREK